MENTKNKKCRTIKTHAYAMLAEAPSPDSESNPPGNLADSQVSKFVEEAAEVSVSNFAIRAYSFVQIA